MIESKQKQNLALSTESGFTIIESLVAIIIVTILMIAMAPIVVLSVATRVQARRVELASTAAKSYIDGVRSGAINPPINAVSRTKTLDQVEAPSSTTLTCKTNRNYCDAPADNLYCIDGDGDNQCTNNNFKDMIVQAAAYNPNLSASFDSSSKEDKIRLVNKNGYLLGVRVYRADAFTSNTTLLAGTGNDRTPLTFTGGTGLTAQQAPLVKMTTEIVSEGSQGTNFSDLCKRIAVANGKIDKDGNPSGCI